MNSVEFIDRSVELSRHSVPADTVLIVQGSRSSAITVLHSGMAELLINGATAVSDDRRRQMVENSLRVGLIKGESLCGIMDLQSPEPARYSVRAVTDCVVSNRPVDAEAVIADLQRNMSLNLQVLCGLSQRVESATYLYRNYRYLWHKLASIADSIALACDVAGPAASPHAVDRLAGSLSEYSAYLRSRVAQLQTPLPEAWDGNVLLGRFQDQLGLYADKDAESIESAIDLPQFLYFKRLLRRPAELLGELFAKDEPSNRYIVQFLSTTLQNMLALNEPLVREIHLLLERIYGADGWVVDAFASQTANSPAALRFGLYLGKFSYRLRKDAVNLLGIDPAARYPAYAGLRRFAQARIAAERQPDGTAQPEAAPVAAGPDGSDLSKYRNLLRRTLEFSDLSEDDKQEIVSLIHHFKSVPDKLSMDGNLGKLRQELSRRYWSLYENCFLKVINTDLKGFVPGTMLHFGLLDETLVTREDLVAVDTAYARSLYVDDPIPVMTLPYFLEKIYTGEHDPSLTEMGETFQNVRKQQERLTKKERATAYLFDDTPEDRVRFEIRRIASLAFGLLYGTRRRAFPLLAAESIVGTAARTLIEPETVAARVQEYRERDFSLFYRDVGTRHRFGVDIVKKEVVPSFVLYPAAGSRMMMWQELDGASRHSRGRIFAPLLYNENTEHALLTVLAQFRWELQKTISGANWMDPVDGGLVGAYYDYITFYAKNPKLTPEAKERVAKQVKRTRSDRDRFVSDYMDWMLYESEGKIRLNPVVREIFYRYCPFKAEAREVMARKPLYSELEPRYQNRVRKSLLKLESRARRFEKSGEPLPEELRGYMAMLQM